MSLRACACALTLLVAARGAGAQQTDSLAIQSAAPLLSIGTVTAGAEPGPALDSTSTYSVAITSTGQKIVARLASPLAPGTTLAVRLEAPSGAVSHGFVNLSTLDQTLVSNLPTGSVAGLRITYRFTARLAAGIVAAASQSVLFTLTSGP